MKSCIYLPVLGKVENIKCVWANIIYFSPKEKREDKERARVGKKER